MSAAQIKQLFGIGPIKTTITIEVVSDTKNVFSECNSIFFLNQGDSVVFLDSMIMIPSGKHFAPPAEIFEYLVKKWAVSFQGTGTNNLLVIKKVYQGPA